MLGRSNQLTEEPACRFEGIHGVTELYDRLEHAWAFGTFEGIDRIAIQVARNGR